MQIHEAMIAVLGELPAIGKNQRNQQQGFNFRGIDDVLNALNPLLAKHGVYPMPRVLERVVNQRTTAKGSVMYEVNLHVEYTFWAADGSDVVGSAWGEGTDSGDKATSKAMTMAYKSCLFQVFAISTAEMADPDATVAEETVVAPKAPPANQPTTDDVDAKAKAAGWDSEAERMTTHSELALAIKGTEWATPMNEWRNENKVKWPMTRDQFNQFMTYLEALQEEAKLGSLDDPPTEPVEAAKAAKPARKNAAK